MALADPSVKADFFFPAALPRLNPAWFPSEEAFVVADIVEMQIGSIHFQSKTKHFNRQWGFLQLHLSESVRRFVHRKVIWSAEICNQRDSC